MREPRCATDFAWGFDPLQYRRAHVDAPDPSIASLDTRPDHVIHGIVPISNVNTSCSAHELLSVHRDSASSRRGPVLASRELQGIAARSRLSRARNPLSSRLTMARRRR